MTEKSDTIMSTKNADCIANQMPQQMELTKKCVEEIERLKTIVQEQKMMIEELLSHVTSSNITNRTEK